jgi:hypothetical protein
MAAGTTAAATVIVAVTAATAAVTATAASRLTARPGAGASPQILRGGALPGDREGWAFGARAAG